MSSPMSDLGAAVTNQRGAVTALGGGINSWVCSALGGTITALKGTATDLKGALIPLGDRSGRHTVTSLGGAP